MCMKITDSSAKVVHGHAQKKGSKRDKPKGSVIHSYSFKKYGRLGAIGKAKAMTTAITLSEIGR